MRDCLVTEARTLLRLSGVQRSVLGTVDKVMEVGGEDTTGDVPRGLFPGFMSLSSSSRVESVFFGGGTPSLASPHTVAAVLEAVAQEVYLPADSEVTLEANPTSAPSPRLAAFGAAGVNRLSVGLQVTYLTHPTPVLPDPRVLLSHWENISGYQGLVHSRLYSDTFFYCLSLDILAHTLPEAGFGVIVIIVVVVFVILRQDTL